MNLNGVAGDMCFCHQFKNTMHTYNTIQYNTITDFQYLVQTWCRFDLIGILVILK